MKAINVFMFAILIVAVSYDQAFAYIDPASGSYLIQMALASLLGALFALKIYWKKVKLFVMARFGKSEASDRDQ